MALPLLVFDTNILLDVWLGRDNDQAVLLVELAETNRVELFVPEYVLIEFRGTALRWVRDETVRVQTIRGAAKEWGRSQELGTAAEALRTAAKEVETKLVGLATQVDIVDTRIRSVAKVPPHTHDVHFRGDLRFLSGRPPDRPVDGLKDCRIYEAVLEIAQADQANTRPKFLVTRDADFDVKELVNELTALGFTIRKDPGRIYGELK
jgi:predicted nucleic acid-binding protein